ncbi:ettA, partial [Symbiodinium sp. KB8]
PTNHLDAESVRWLEDYLGNYRGTVLAITHDRYFLNQVAGWILEVDRANLFAYAGNYSTWLDKKQQRMALEAKTDAKRVRAMQEELEWIRQGTKGQQKKSKARIKAFETAKEDDMRLRSEKRFLSGAIAIPPAPRIGSPIVRMKDICVTIPDGRTLIKKLSFNLAPGSIVGVVGPNGTGKSTLMRLIAGELQPDSGEIEVGKLVQLGHVEQSRYLPPEESVGSVISEGLTEIDVGLSRPVPVMAWLSKFNLGPMAKKPVKALSGGERSRVHLARTLKRPCNVLILDEPTNDLDVDTLRSLEEALEEYNGCAFIVSHDRFFLDRICTHTVSFEGEGDVVWFPGSFSAYERYRKENHPELHARAKARLDGSQRSAAAKNFT